MYKTAKFENLNPYVQRVREHPLMSVEASGVFEHYKNKKCVVDLGCGNGHFLSQYLEKYPDFVGLGVERRYKRIFKTQKKLEALGARGLRSEIEDFVAMSPENFWDEVWIQFPDPWPKKRHECHRMIRLSLYFHLNRILKPGGRFCFLSDHADYWNHLMEVQTSKGLFPMMQSLQGDLFHSEPPSLFKKLFLQKELPLYSLIFKK